MLVARGNIERRQAIVKIGFQPFVPEALEVRPTSPTLEVPVHEYRALIDTGAQRSCLTHSVIAAEGLTHHGRRPIKNVHGEELHYLFWANIGFVCERVEHLNDRAGMPTYFGLPDPAEVIDISNNYWFDAIIGMDLLSRSSLRIDRDGSFALILE